MIFKLYASNIPSVQKNMLDIWDVQPIGEKKPVFKGTVFRENLIQKYFRFTFRS